jgi:Ca2+-binding EF-hand superfamily protein
MPQVRDIFEAFDADASNTIDEVELKELLKEMCVPATDEDVQVRRRPTTA